jgi:ABC-type nitrate/sulfonate/bicarbonate transport system permease component
VSFNLFDIRRDLKRETRVMLAVLSWALVVLVWFAITEWGKLPPFSLPKPMGVVSAFARRWTE